MLRTHTCGQLRKNDANKEVTLSGWIDTIRSHGGVAFIDIRDRYGKTQVVFVKSNKDWETGEVELFGEKITIFNKSPPLPFEINDPKVNEEVKLKWRYLDLRNSKLRGNLLLKNKIYKAIHDFMEKQEFIYVDTPILAKSTPEGARDYLVPSRVNPGQFYALPQSPQLFKQLLMVSSFDKYYQIARCFRDEDLRADRQPE